MDLFLGHIEAQRAKIRKQISKLQEELEKLDYSEKQYRASGASMPQVDQIDMRRADTDLLAPRGPEPLPGGQQLKGTIKDRVLAILERNPDGMTSSQILNVLRISGLPTLARESLSPQLSRLRNHDQKIALSHGIWTLRKTESHGG
jgi:hypothetical protein